MQLRQLSQFLAVADALSFSRAAERLHMAQPPLSIAIRKLEKELNAKLFERRGRTIRLTPAGQAAVRAARRCLANAEEVRAVTRHASQGERGRVRLGFVGSATHSLLPKLLPAFRARHPGIELVLRETPTNADTLMLLEAEQLDAGLVRFPTSTVMALGFQFIERDVFVAVLPKGHPLASLRSVTLKALATEPLINFVSTQVAGLHALVMLAFQGTGLTPRVAQEATHVQTVMTLVESGLGVALVPSRDARLASKNLTFRPIRGLPTGITTGIALAYPTENEPMAVRRLRAVAAELAADR
jgi:DNA-binding transcriptional LysR family regulator